jgi:pSer/pThr/pTyr-binding forkhead associated (FHA) protein
VRDRVPFIVEGDKLMIKDLQSTNGTFINDSEMDPMIDTAVELGSTIVFGATKSL